MNTGAKPQKKLLPETGTNLSILCMTYPVSVAMHRGVMQIFHQRVSIAGFGSLARPGYLELTAEPCGASRETIRTPMYVSEAEEFGARLRRQDAREAADVFWQQGPASA